MLKKILYNTLIYTLGPQLPRIASLFVLPIITKDLTTTDYGIAAVVMAYTGLLGGMRDLGFGVNMVNAFYKYPNRWHTSWRQFHGYLSLWSVLFSLLQALLLYFVIPAEAKMNQWLIILMYSITSLFFETTITFGSRYYQYAQRPFYMATTSAIVGIISIGLNLVTISYFKMGYMGWFISTFISTFIAFLFYFFPLYFKYKLVPIIKIRKRFIRNQLKIALPTIPHNYSSYLLNTSDRLVMSTLGIKIGQIGIYNIAYTFGNYFDFMGTAIGMAVGPIYTKLYSLKREVDLRLITFMLQSFFLLGSFILSLWLREIFQFLIKNEELQAGYYLAIIVVMGYNYRPMYWAVGIKISFYEKTQYLWRISFGAGVVNIILNFIFIPIYGFKVAAITSFVGLMYIGFSGFFMKVYKDMENENFYPIIWILIIIVVSVLAYILKDVDIQVKIFITIFVSVIGCVAFLRYKDVFNRIEI